MVSLRAVILRTACFAGRRTSLMAGSAGGAGKIAQVLPWESSASPPDSARQDDKVAIVVIPEGIP